ncbi:hypothetical protein PINS_up012328 [Pythium insidiosum]|nr:hypothetical protein PINS_up012328 [Pythium insidiosum]
MMQLHEQLESLEAECRPLDDRSSSSSASAREMDPARLHQILLAQNNALMQVAAHVAEVHERTEEMRQLFLRKMKEDLVRHGEKNPAAFKNPFDKKKKNAAARESDIDTIRFKTSVAPTIIATAAPTAAPAAAPASGFGFGSTAAATTTTTQPAGGLGFGGFSTATTTAAPGGFSFGGGAASAASTAAASTTTSTAPKQVTFNLGGAASTGAPPAISTAAPATSGFSFSAAPATPAPTTSFMPAPSPTAAAASSGKRSGSLTNKSSGLRARQKR